MYSWEKSLRQDTFQNGRKNPSFSSSLLDEIYRSIDGNDLRHEEFNSSYRETMKKKQSNGGNARINRATIEEEKEMSSLRRACMIEKWMEKKVSEKAGPRRQQYVPELDGKSLYDTDPLFFSSTSISSDSSSGGFSSSETDSVYGTKTRNSCFAPLKPKPIRTCMPARSEKSKRTEKTERSLFYEQREVHMYDDYHYNSVSDHSAKHEEGFIKSKSRALKIYSNLKSLKQPISPGGRLATLFNSFFSTGNIKKKSTSSIGGIDDASLERKTQASTCSSASSFSRSCLSKTSPSSREKLRNGVKRSVRFCPVSVIVDEDSRPCGHKSIHEQDSSSMSTPTLRNVISSSTRGCEDELSKYKLIEKSRRVEEAAREFLQKYHHSQKKNDAVMSNIGDYKDNEEDEEDDDGLSCSSSDLFELDHLAFIGKKDRYCEELPVYETTHVDTNRAIASGLIL